MVTKREPTETCARDNKDMHMFCTVHHIHGNALKSACIHLGNLTCIQNPDYTKGNLYFIANGMKLGHITFPQIVLNFSRNLCLITQLGEEPVEIDFSVETNILAWLFKCVPLII